MRTRRHDSVPLSLSHRRGTAQAPLPSCGPLTIDDELSEGGWILGEVGTLVSANAALDRFSLLRVSATICADLSLELVAATFMAVRTLATANDASSVGV